MVLQGFSIGVLPSALIEREVEAGRLVTLLDAYELVGATTDIRLAYSSRALLPAKVRAFVEHAVRFCAGESTDETRARAGLASLSRILAVSVIQSCRPCALTTCICTTRLPDQDARPRAVLFRIKLCIYT